MKLGTLKTVTGTQAVRIDGEAKATPIAGFADVGALLTDPNWEEIAAHASAAQASFAEADLAPVIPRPGKIICVGVNYAKHIAEMGRERPDYPTLFIKFPESLTGPFDDVHAPSYAHDALDFEGELAFVIGKRARRVSGADAPSHIAGYAIMNDYSQRDIQYRTLQWHQGKALEGASGFGPWLTTADSFELGGTLRTYLDGELMQEAATSDMVFTPDLLIEYISHIYPLNPSDVIATGTPGGVGHARDPKRYIQDGQTVTIEVEGLGRIANRTVYER